MWRPLFLVASSALILSVSALAAQSASPCASEPYGALDFWVGEWRVVDGEGVTVGTNRVEKLQGGCLIEENWSSARGGGGQSMNYYDPAADLWKQHWVDQRGTVVAYAGTARDDGLRFEGQHIRADGTVTMARVELRRLENGRLHHLIEHSSDGGDTWTSYFDATYLPVGGQLSDVARVEPTAASNPAAPVTDASERAAVREEEPAEPIAQPIAAGTDEPAPSDTGSTQGQAARQAEQEGSEVTAVSRVLEREEIPEEQAPELRMASPMVLEIVPGLVDALPENTAWQTDETKEFICNDIVVRKVTMARRTRGDEVELEVAARLYTGKRMRRAALLFEILLGDQVVASEELRKIRAGINIPAHGDEGLWVQAKMRLPREQFEALFADGADRKLRLTLTAP